MTETQEIQSVRENLKTWLAAFNAKDIDTLFTLYDPESVYANAGAPLMVGADQIRGWYAQAFQSIEGTLLFKEEKLFLEGTMALIVGKYFFQPPEGVGVPDDANLTGRVSLVYRKPADGKWGLLFDMDNTPPDVSPADFA
ncbi:DUF4440 domain-containing protein [Amylibacter sp. SFDW26]|uniref:YybH family protein n=1 Tax=Amylibacter sp. SFDW26 TaxID=2652722 RepID=UPI0012614380|nr:nuclear transport factor 2 family protein [Amylibacter sp. SFDW26]KAB7615313.1 DUF4440 domain-containing protein [Amylibacter sp. SFDW26]